VASSRCASVPSTPLLHLRLDPTHRLARSPELLHRCKLSRLASAIGCRMSAVDAGHRDLVLGFRPELLTGDILFIRPVDTFKCRSGICFGLTFSLIRCVFGGIGNGMTAGRIWREMPFQNGSCGFADAWVIPTCAYDGSDGIGTTSRRLHCARRCLWAE
jgi:hypothetical protein